MGFVIASGLRYQPRHVVVTQDAARGFFAKRPGCIPPQMSPALTAPPACRGRRCFMAAPGPRLAGGAVVLCRHWPPACRERRCFMSALAPGSPGAPLFLAARI